MCNGALATGEGKAGGGRCWSTTERPGRPAAPFREPQSPVRPQHGAFKLEPGAFPHLVRSPPLEAHSVVYLPLGGMT